jgi:hypothetical protein
MTATTDLQLERRVLWIEDTAHPHVRREFLIPEVVRSREEAGLSLPVELLARPRRADVETRRLSRLLALRVFELVSGHGPEPDGALFPCARYRALFDLQAVDRVQVAVSQ